MASILGMMEIDQIDPKNHVDSTLDPAQLDASLGQVIRSTRGFAELPNPGDRQGVFRKNQYARGASQG